MTESEKKREMRSEAAPDERNMAAPSTVEAVYTAKELAAAHEKQFGCSYELVVAALMQAKITKATLADGAELVDRFRKQEVK